MVICIPPKRIAVPGPYEPLEDNNEDGYENGVYDKAPLLPQPHIKKRTNSIYLIVMTYTEKS